MRAGTATLCTGVAIMVAGLCCPPARDPELARFPPHRPSIEEKIVREAGPMLAPLALAVAWQESRFKPKAVSKTHDFGVFQIHSTTAVKLHLWNPLDEDLNIVAGVGLLRVGWEIYGSEAGAVCYFRHPARCGAK